MDVLARLEKLFTVEKIVFKKIEHEPVITCEDAARIRGTKPEQGAKALVCFADKKPILIVLPCSRKLDFKKFKLAFNVKDLRMATPEEVKTLTNLEIGSIPPIGTVMNLPTYVEKILLEENEICFNAGKHEVSMVIKSADFVTSVQPVAGSFTVPKQ